MPEEQWQEYRRPPHRQEYAKPVTSDVDIEPTEEELGNISAACNRLWGLDLNRLSPGRDYEIECGEGKRVGDQQDRADNAFFSYVNEDVFRRPTFARFYALLDNYSAKQGVREHVSEEEKQEENAFIEEISRTAPIQYLFRYLVAQRVVSDNQAEFKEHLHSLWFGLYGRAGAHDSSSAFEHVFVGEVKRGEFEDEISGFHNWIKVFFFYLGALCFKGDRLIIGIGNGSAQALSFLNQFELGLGLLKPVKAKPVTKLVKS